MNKLVSRNPVQRFKQGRKIIFAQQGGMQTYKGDPIIAIENGRGAVDKGNGMLLWVPTNKFDTDNSRKFYQKANSIKSSLTSSVKNLFNQKSSDISKNGTPFTKNKVVSAPINNRFVKGFEGVKDEILKSGGVRAMQQKLKDAGYLDKFGVDGIWGNDTQKAYNAWKQLQNKVKFTVPSYNDIPSFVPQTTETSQAVTPTLEQKQAISGITPTQEEIMLSNVSTPTLENYNATRTLNLNKAQTRNWINQNYGNAYSITGGARAAVRRILGGLGTTEDKDLILQNPELYKVLQKQGYWRFKQGGSILPSKNIIERFKQRKFK